MPITTNESYLPTMQEFINHWTQVNLELGATPLILPGAYSVASLTADRTTLEAAIIALQPADNSRTNAIADRDIKKAAIRIRLSQFRAAVQSFLYGSVYVRSLPKLPLHETSAGKFLSPFDDMANLWAQLNAAPPAGFTAPLTLPSGYLVANFITELATLRTALVASDNAAQNARIARDKRDALLPGIRTRLQQYRKAVPARVATTSVLLPSIPTYSPPPGATPDAVSVSGVWDATQESATLTWTQSLNPALSHYAIRTAPGPSYRAADETSIGTVAATETTFSTDTGLAAAGSAALYRVYVVLTTGNEKGSATVKVIRPVA